MKLLYAKRFSKDVDGIQKETKIKKNLVKVIENIRKAGSLAELKEVRKITGYRKYYRIRLGDYRLGIKATKTKIELIRFLHRKDIYRRFP